MWAHAARASRGAGQQRGSRRRQPQDRSETRVTRAVAWRLARSRKGARVATSGAATPRDAAGKGREWRWATADGQATKRCQRCITKTVCKLGARREHLWTSQRGATPWAATSQATRREQDALKACDLHGALRHRKHNARWNVARGNAPRHPGRWARQMLGDGGRPGNKALPAENGGNGSQCLGLA